MLVFCTWRLLQLDHLFVGEVGAVVQHAEGVAGVAVGAEGGLGYPAPVDFHCGGEGAHVALEEGLPHLWDDVGRADHHPTDRDQLVDVWRQALVKGLPNFLCSWPSLNSYVK